jgi:hypothetical protein
MVYPEALAQRSQAGCEALAILLRRLVVGKLNRPRINPLASFGYVYVIFAACCGPSCYGGQHPTLRTVLLWRSTPHRIDWFLRPDSHSRGRPAITTIIHWHIPGPVRHPACFIEPCLPTVGRLVPAGRRRAR